MFGFLKRRRRKRLRASPLSSSGLDVIRKNVPLYGRLWDGDGRELEGHVQVFLAEKHFEGCGGLVLTEEIKLTIAGHACVLLLHRQTDYFPRLITILVYPAAYVARLASSIGGGVVMEENQVRLGEAWKSGVVVVSWDDLQETARGLNEGRNLVLHEFAHQLDMENGTADGVPVLERRSQYRSWSRVLGSEFEQLRRDSARGRYTVLDKYGGTDPAEFFAVATEAFFEKSHLLWRRHRQLYDELKGFYLQDPVAWKSVGPTLELNLSADDPDDSPPGSLS
jgi:Mlc titration factor MtfA (ptsG expression regulator)